MEIWKATIIERKYMCKKCLKDNFNKNEIEINENGQLMHTPCNELLVTGSLYRIKGDPKDSIFDEARIR